MAVSLLFAGHMIDKPDRSEPRFPASLEQVARMRIGKAIDHGLEDRSTVLGFASGARGGDILFHEECRGRGMGTVIVLPFEPDEFVRLSVEGAMGVEWPKRFWALWNATPGESKHVLGGLAPVDEAEQAKAFAACNTKLLEMARQHGRVHLIALWDGKGGDGPGGTADLVSRLREEDKPDIIAPSDLYPARSDQLRQLLSTKPTIEVVEEAAALLIRLRDSREFDRLCGLADLVCRLKPDDAKARRLYAQGLIETGRVAAAVDMLEAAKKRYGKAHTEYAEFEGLIGRAYKQLFMDTLDPENIWANRFIESSFAEYKAAYARDPIKNFWHGVNLGALSRVASVRFIKLNCRSAEDYARDLLAALEKIPPGGDRDAWWYATKAEAHSALKQWELSEKELRSYITRPETTPFMLASTLRQLRNLWEIQAEPRGARLLQMLEAVLMTRPQPGAVLKIGSQHLLEMRALEPKNDEQLQRLMGPQGFENIQWYRKGLERAASVAAITERLGSRFGTGFAVRAADLGVTPGDEMLLLTNFHVLNSAGLGGRTDFGNVEVVFEAIAETPLKLMVDSVVAESNSDVGLDYALFRLKGSTERLRPLDLTRFISAPDQKARVYVIGYPLGDVMQFSLQNNLLLDHECEPTGKPPNPARRRVQYSASTEKGNSGSPVFDDKWDCIALHHAGGKRSLREERYGIARLNGLNTAWEANEGIWIGSIVDDIKAKQIKLT